jgi:hypothetical protein
MDTEDNSLEGTLPGSLDETPQSLPRSTSPNSMRLARLAALEQRNTSTASESEEKSAYDAFDDSYEKRIEFRRLIDPGILRPNQKEVAIRSLRVSRHILL